MPKLTSIILSCKIRNKTEAHMTMLAIDCIGKYTDLEYELIVIDPEPSEPIRDDYGVLPKFIHLEPKPDPGYTAGMNLGAKEAKGDYLVFIQNDVFVNEGWLPGLRQYLESGRWDMVFPDQVPRSRDFVLDSRKRDPFDPESLKGSRDEGLLMITREMFDKMGDFNEELSILQARDFYERFNNAGGRWTDTNKVLINHIMGASNWRQMADDPEEYDRRMGKDAKILNG